MIGGFFVALASGCGTVIKILASVYVGEEDRDAIKQLIKLALTKVMAMMLVIMAIMMLFSGTVALIFFPAYAVLYWKRIPKNIDEWLLFRDDFGVKDDDRLRIHVTSMEDVTGFSERIQTFVTDQGHSGKAAYFSALAMEEMAGNIVNYSFGADHKKHALDVRVVSTKNGILLRIKDDCKAFNPVEMNRIFNHEDPFKNIGIRMISKLADEFSYQNTFGLNVLTIVVK